MKTKRIIVVGLFFLLVICGCYKLDLYSTAVGQYLGEGYNFFTPIVKFPNNRERLLQAIPASLKEAYAKQSVNLDTVEIDSQTYIWGPVEHPEKVSADRTYNVVFHPDESKWRGDNADFNVNRLAGLFAPNGVEKGAVSIAFDSFESLNINKHDSIYYSPNNGQFKIKPGRKIATFWTALISEDKSKTNMQFNIILDDETLKEQMGKDSKDFQDLGVEGIIVALTNIAEAVAGEDQSAVRAAIALLRKLNPEHAMIEEEQEEKSEKEEKRRLEADEALARELQEQEEQGIQEGNGNKKAKIDEELAEELAREELRRFEEEERRIKEDEELARKLEQEEQQ